MSLVQSLPQGALDIVGDIHGEHDALCALLRHLGYDAGGRHPEGRTLVFVGDLCDRGPDSPAVIEHVQRLMDAGRACAVIGNHEINLLREEAKDGSGWAYARRANGQTLLVVSNFYGEPVEFALPAELQSGEGRLLLGNYPDSPARPQSCKLRPYESLIWLMEQ